MTRKPSAAGVLALSFLLTLPAFAQTVSTIYQAQLKLNGVAVTGVHNFVFRLCSASSSGGVLQTFPSAGALPVNVVSGLLTQELIFDVAQFDGADRWLEIEVDGVSLSPRQHLTCAPYAGAARKLVLPFSSTANAPGSGDSLFSITNTATTLLNRAGYFQANSTQARALQGTASAATGTTVGVFGDSFSPTGTGVLGRAQATTGVCYGGAFESDSDQGYGVYGLAYNNFGTNYGGYFLTISPSGTGAYGQGYNGLWGESPQSIGNGVRGTANGGSNAWGVWGEAMSGRGVYGDSVSGSGVFGQSTSGEGVHGESDRQGVVGVATGAVAGVSGVAGTADFVGGAGVLGSSVNGKGVVGVHGHNSGAVPVSFALPGVWGDSDTGNGVIGSTSANGGAAVIGVCGGNNFGIYGQNPVGTAVYGISNNWAGYFQGKIFTTNLIANQKNFRIDHPLDPANKYLQHYCQEGPEPQNVYNGTVRTGDDGFACIQLPPYFDEINRDVRYQLTVIDDGEEFTLVKVTQEVSDHRFQIRTSRPKIRVCWEVKAVRNDAFTRAQHIAAELDKPPAERGKYMNPELFGHPAEDGVNPPMLRLAP
ncbi:MAG: hypothetical protein U1D55_02785 [Phycisphaerae bacterium]